MSGDRDQPEAISQPLKRWHQTKSSPSYLSVDAVWDRIVPVVPDHLEALADNLFEAQWWKPVPMMDPEILKWTEGVVLIEAPYEPAHLPEGLAVRFSMACYI